MSELERLIQKYCPDEVEYKKISECCVVVKGEQLNKDLLQKEESFDFPSFLKSIFFRKVKSRCFILSKKDGVFSIESDRP